MRRRHSEPAPEGARRAAMFAWSAAANVAEGGHLVVPEPCVSGSASCALRAASERIELLEKARSPCPHYGAREEEPPGRRPGGSSVTLPSALRM